MRTMIVYLANKQDWKYQGLNRLLNDLKTTLKFSVHIKYLLSHADYTGFVLNGNSIRYANFNKFPGNISYLSSGCRERGGKFYHLTEQPRISRWRNKTTRCITFGVDHLWDQQIALKIQALLLPRILGLFKVTRNELWIN